MKKGFTLIELLVVVLIIGILSAVALPQYTKSVEKSRATQALTILNALKTNTDIYLLENGGLPSELTTILPGDDRPVMGTALDFDYGHGCGDLEGMIAPTCGVIGNFAFGGYCNSSGCSMNVVKFKGTPEWDNEEYVASYSYASGTGWTKYYTQKNAAKANLKPTFQALGFTTN